MFGSLFDDRHALLLVAGVALAAAYVAGGVAVGEGLLEALEAQADRFEEGARLAWWGPDPLASRAPGGARVPDGAAVLGVAEVVDAEGRAWLAACVRAGAPGLPAETAGLGRGVAADRVTFPDGTVVSGRVGSPHAPAGWVFVPCARLAAWATPGEAWLLPPGADAPAGAEVAPLSGIAPFVRVGGRGVATGLALLVGVTSLVTVGLSASLTTQAVWAHRHDLHLVRALGASHADVRRLLARWLARVVGLGLLVGASWGVVAAYAAFSLGNRAGIRAPVVPAPDPLALLGAMAALAVAGLAAGVWAGARWARRLEGVRLEAAA